MKNFVFLMSFILSIPSLAYAQNLPGYWEGGTGGENKSPYSQPYPRTYPEDYRTAPSSLPGYFNPEAGSTTPFSPNPRGLLPLTPNPYQPTPSQRQR